jgi:hypothetical protein
MTSGVSREESLMASFVARGVFFQSEEPRLLLRPNQFRSKAQDANFIIRPLIENASRRLDASAKFPSGKELIKSAFLSNVGGLFVLICHNLNK